MEKKVNSELIYKGKVITVFKDDILIDKNGGINAIREVVIHNGGACALVKTKDNKIKFVKQYRYAIKDYLIELPAGKIDPNEPHELTIVRELEEEVGVKANSVKYIGKLVLSPGFSNEIIYMYYVDDYEECDTHFDEDEDLEQLELTKEEVIEMIRNGEIYDSKTISLFMLVKDLI